MIPAMIKGIKHTIVIETPMLAS